MFAETALSDTLTIKDFIFASVLYHKRTYYGKSRLPLVTTVLIGRHARVLSRQLAVSVFDFQKTHFFISQVAFLDDVTLAMFDWSVVTIPRDIQCVGSNARQ